VVTPEQPAPGSPAAKTRVYLSVISRKMGKRTVMAIDTSNGSGRLQACAGRRLVAGTRVRNGRWTLRLPRAASVKQGTYERTHNAARLYTPTRT
jgi:5-hydroxyisourate hydrolase-like protein (transthyretin family)